jgi:hypothetical protein
LYGTYVQTTINKVAIANGGVQCLLAINPVTGFNPPWNVKEITYILPNLECEKGVNPCLKLGYN